LGFRSRSLGRTVTRVYDEALRAHGITVAQYGVLAAIAVAGPLRPAELGRKLNLEKSTLSRNVRLMVEQRWVEVVTDATGRLQQLTLTKEGRERLEKAFPAWERAQGEVRSLLGDELAQALSARIPGK
jgi:DNA-binding MarR family transcriptional regulator